MAKISGSEIRPGMVIEHDGALWAAVKTMDGRATLENGLRLMVPPFVTAGEKVEVDTNEVVCVRRAD